MEFSLSCLQHLMVISYHCVLLFFSIRFHLRGPPVLHLGLVKYYTIMLEDNVGGK